MRIARVHNLDIDLDHPVDIGIPVDFDGAQPSFYNAERAVSEAYRSGSFIGDTRRGGSCNVESLQLNPHCNGTHTECAGHITQERIYISDIPSVTLIPAALVSLSATSIISRSSLEATLREIDTNGLQALVVRTNPNETGKTSRDYSAVPPTHFAPGAIRFLNELGIDHLVVDIPSIDDASSSDLECHHLFWDIDSTGVPSSRNYLDRTITEMVFVPDSLDDGRYALSISWPLLMSDAAPSRPILYPLAR